MEDELCDTALINLINAIENNRTDSEKMKLYEDVIQMLQSSMYELQSEMEDD